MDRPQLLKLQLYQKRSSLSGGDECTSWTKHIVYARYWMTYAWLVKISIGNAVVAQQVEHRSEEPSVVRSIRSRGTNKTYTAIHNDKQGKPPPQKGLASSTLVLLDQGLCPILILIHICAAVPDGGVIHRGVGNRKTQRKNQKNVSWKI